MRLFARILLILMCATAARAEISFTVTPDKTRIAPGEPVNVTATLISTKNLGTMRLALPPNPAFDVLRSNQNQSSQSSIQIINGATTKTDQITYCFYYTISPKQAGGFTFPALSLTIDGATYTSQPFTVTVSSEAASNPDVVIRLQMSKTTLYAGQQGILTILVGHKPNAPIQLSNEGFGNFIQSVDKSLARDFSTVRLTGNNLGRSAQILDGEQYMVYKVMYALFPLNSGAITIPQIPFEYAALSRVSRRADPFDDFFGGGFFGGGMQATARTALSNRVALTVKPLPPPPAGFSGAVGKFTLRSSADPTSVAAGDAVTCKIALSGNTRPGSMGDMTLPLIKNVDIFPPEKQSRSDTTAGGITSHKTFKYLLIPRQEGQVAVPPLTWTYFDPDQQSYQTLRSDPITLTVTPGREGSKPQTRYLTQEDIREIGKDIRYIKTPARLKPQNDKPYRSPLFFILFPLPFFIMAVALLYRVQSRRSDRDLLLSLRKRALARTLRDLRTLERDTAKADAAAFLGRLTDHVEKYITHKFGFPAQGKTIDELTAALNEWGARTETTGQLSQFIRDADAFRFGGPAQGEAARGEMLRKARDLVTGLDAETRKKA